MEVAAQGPRMAPLRQWTSEAGAAWNRFWFAPADPTPLAAVRIGLAALLAWSTLTAWPQLEDWLRPDSPEVAALVPASMWSLHRGSAPWAWHVLQGVQLAAIVGLGLGWRTRLACPVAFVLHVSFINAAHDAAFGYDAVASLLLLYLSLAPCGAAWSLDARRRGEGKPRPSVGANLGLRLIQLHACAIYLAAGLAKLEGATWWSGMAAYQSMLAPERWLAPFSFEFAFHYPWTATVLSNLLTYLTLAYEIGFPFLVWKPLLRGPLLVTGAAMHLGTVVFMGMDQFGLAMLLLLLAFVPADWLRRSSR